MDGQQDRKDETASNFSYTQSENLNSTNPHPTEERIASEASSQYDSLTPTPGHTPKSSVFKSFHVPSAPLSLAHRDSLVSNISQYDNEVAQQVSVQAINQDKSPRVKYSHNSPLQPPRSSPPLKPETVDDETDSVFSKEGSIKIGKLNTKSINRKSQVVEPMASYSTTIDGAIPPRSNRRPKSETVLVDSDLHKDIDKFKKTRKGHYKGLSLTYTEDLDRLMERAGTMRGDYNQQIFRKIGDEDDATKSVPQIPPITVNASHPLSAGHSEASTDGNYETADNAKYTSGLSHSLLADVEEAKPKTMPVVPPRPSAENITRARIASNQMKALASDDDGAIDERSMTTVQLPKRENSMLNTMKNDGHDEDNNSEFIEPDVEFSKPPSRAVSQPQVWNETHRSASGVSREGSRVFSKEGGPVRPPSTQFAATAPLEPEEEEKEEGEEEIEEENDKREEKKEKNGEEDEEKEEHLVNPVAAAVGAGVAAGAIGVTGVAGAVGLASGAGGSASADAEEPAYDTSLTIKEEAPLANDDEYYDIEEPVLVSKPLRGKSVKDSTRHHKKKTKAKRAKSKRVRPESEAGNLKPFSYHTLINLLESINGTVIGEEFNQLNLPVKEKQLIEKIIDALSRLTSDMVLDDKRYEIGIERLEKAHRVLEGFL